MAKGKIINALYRCQQAVVDKIGIENIDKKVRIGIKVKKTFDNGYELANYLYELKQRNKFLWLQQAEFSLIDGAFNEDFLITDFTRCKYDMDYRVFNIYKPCRWLKYKLVVEEGTISLQNFEIAGQQISNKE